MAATNNGREQTATDLTGLGLLANGVSGPWRIDVDETTSGPDKRFLQIEGPLAYFYFEIPSLDVIELIGDFLGLRVSAGARQSDRSMESDWELVIGTDSRTPVRLVRDDEADDRFFILVGRTNDPIVRYTLFADDVKCVAAALEQVREDLADG